MMTPVRQASLAIVTEPHSLADRQLRQDRDHRAARSAANFRWGDHRVAQQGAANLSAPHAHCRRADRRRLPGGHQYAPGAARSGSVVPRRREQGHCEPGLAQDQKRLGLVERALANGGADRAPHPRRHFVRVRLDRKATSISLLVVIGVREDGQKVLLAVKNMGGDSPKPGAPFSTI